MLKIDNLTVNYGKNKTLSSLSFEIGSGEIFALLGKSDSEKTSIFDCCFGSLSFDGEIFIDGSSVKENKFECKKKLFYVTNKPDIYAFMTGQEYLSFICSIYKINKKEEKELTEKYTEVFFTKDLLSKPCSEFTREEKQSISYTAAFICSPSVLILQEPFKSLSPVLTSSLKNAIKEFCIQGKSVLLSSSSLKQLHGICNRCAIIKEGKLIKCDTVENLLSDRSNKKIISEFK